MDDQKRLDGVKKRYQATYREFGDSASGQKREYYIYIPYSWDQTQPYTRITIDALDVFRPRVSLVFRAPNFQNESFFASEFCNESKGIMSQTFLP